MFQDALFVPRPFVSANAGRDFFPAARHEEVEQGEQIGDAVLDWGAGEEKSSVGTEGCESLGVSSASILDVLRFIADHASQRVCGKEVDVANEGAVRSDDEIMGGGFAVRGQSLVSVVNEGLEFGAKAFGFPAPVLDQRSGTDDERGSWESTLFLEGFHEGEGLHGFA